MSIFVFCVRLSVSPISQEHPDKAGVIRNLTGSGPGHGVYFTPDDLQDMSSRAIDILKRFVDENTMLRKEVVRLQDERILHTITSAIFVF